MACVSFTRHGYKTILDMMSNVDTLLTSTSHAGLQDTSVGYFVKKSGTIGTGTVIYEATTNIDPLANFTPTGSMIRAGWRLAFIFHDTDRMSVGAATELQYPNSGTISYLTDRKISGSAIKEPAGIMSAQWTGTNGDPIGKDNEKTLSEVWLNRQFSNNADATYPMSFTLTLTNRGIFFAVWEGSQEEAGQTYDNSGNDYYANSSIKWLLVQRPVDRVTGHVRGGGAMRGNNDPAVETSRCPVFCVYGLGSPNSYRRFVVRELDVLTPSRKRLVSESTEDCNAMINKYQQNSITETGEFVVTFLNNLTTSRYRYGDELDMLGTVGAEVIGPGTSINVSVYNETVSGQSVSRTYTALYANNPFGVGMRLMALTAANTIAENSHVTSS